MSSKLFLLTVLLFVNTIVFSQDYLAPITTKRATGNLPQGVDTLVLEEILGCSKFAVPNRGWSAIYATDGQHIIVGGYNYVGCFDQQTGERIWGRFMELEVQYESTNPIRGLAVHQPTNRLLIGTDKGKVWLLNFETGETEDVLAADFGWVMAVAISPDGKFGAATDIKGDCRMWDLKRGREIPLPHSMKSRGEAVCFSSDSKYLAVGFNNALHLIDWDNGTTTRYQTPSTVQSIAFINKDREVLIAGWEGFVQRIHLESKKVLWSKTVSDWLIQLQVLPNQTSALAISPFSVWHLDWEADKLTDLGIPVRTAMDLHPDGQTILTLNNFANRVEQVNWTTRKPVNNSSYYTEPPMKLAFSPDGKYLAAGGYFTADKIIFWETKEWTIAGEVEGNKQHRFNQFSFTKDSKHFYASIEQNNVRIGNPKPLILVDIPTFAPADNIRMSYNRMQFRHQAVNLESTETVHLKRRIPLSTSAFYGSLDDSMNRHLFGGWTIEEAYFGGVSNEHMLYIYESTTGQKMAGAALSDFGVIACAIHPEAKVMAVTAWDGLVYIYRWR